MRVCDEEVVVGASDTHRMVREADRQEGLLPLVPGAPTHRIRSVWRIESKAQCSACGRFRCSSTCEHGEPEHESWELEAKVTVTLPDGYPYRVELVFGDKGLSSTNDPQTMLWLAKLLQELSINSAIKFDIPIDELPASGAGYVADEVVVA